MALEGNAGLCDARFRGTRRAPQSRLQEGWRVCNSHSVNILKWEV